MTTPKVKRRHLLLGGAALAAPATILSATRARAQAELSVGATVPITGNFAASGIQYYNSLRMAQDDINAAGGVNGTRLRIVFEDTQASNTTAVNALVKLVRQVNPPFIFLSSLSTQNLAMEPEITRARVPTIYGGGLVAIQERKNPFMFRLRPPDNLLGAAIAFGVTDVLKKAKPGILYMQDDYGIGASSIVESSLARSNITPVGKEAFSPRDNDFSAQLLSLKNKGADIIVAITYNRDGALIMKQRRSLGIDLPFLCGSAMIAPSTTELLEPADLAGVYAVGDTVLGEVISPASADFVKRYTERFGFAPDPFGAAYYDAAMIVQDGLKKVGSDAAKLRDYLAALKDFQGVARTYSADEHLNLAHSVVLVQFEAGAKTFRKLAQYPAA